MSWNLRSAESGKVQLSVFPAWAISRTGEKLFTIGGCWRSLSPNYETIIDCVDPECETQQKGQPVISGESSIAIRECNFFSGA